MTTVRGTLFSSVFVGVVLIVLGGCGRSERHAAAAAPLADTPSKPASAPIYAPMIFNAEGGPLVTSACVSLEEISPAAEFGGVRPVFDATVQAVLAEYKAGPTVTLSRIGHVYAFDDFVVVHAMFRRGDADRPWPFWFAWGSDGKLASWSDATVKKDGKVIISASDSKDRLSKALVSGWLDYTSPNSVDAPHCAAEFVEHATHRVPIGPDASRATRLQLLLRGAAVDSPGDLRAVTERVTRTVKSIELALTAKDFNALSAQLTDGSAKQLQKWWATASAEEREGYFKAMLPKTPFFVFDASPLVIVYARAGASIYDMYFVAVGDRLAWESNPPITDGRSVFTRGPLKDAAALPEPFSNLRIK